MTLDKDYDSTKCKWSGCLNSRAISLGLMATLLSSTVYLFYRQSNIEKELEAKITSITTADTARKDILYTTSYDPFELKLFDRLDRIINNNFFRDFDQSTSFSSTRSIKSNFTQENDKYILSLEVPGFTKEEVKVETKGDYLIITTNKDDGKGAQSKLHSSFKQTIFVQRDVDHNQITSSLKNGVLTIVMPKSKDKISSGRDVPVDG